MTRSHPYYDEKTDKDKPTWYMVDVKFTRRLEYPPTLVLIKTLASTSSFPKEVEYIGEAGLSAIKSMALVNRGRLSKSPLKALISAHASQASNQSQTKHTMRSSSLGRRADGKG